VSGQNALPLRFTFGIETNWVGTAELSVVIFRRTVTGSAELQAVALQSETESKDRN
jgi:hypothetical protein